MSMNTLSRLCRGREGADWCDSISSAFWPRFSLKAWKDRLLDAVDGVDLRLCRRDPRDSADAEQALFEQIDDCLDRSVPGSESA